MAKDKKYAALARVLPRLNEVADVNYQQKVRLVRDAISSDREAVHRLLEEAVNKATDEATKSLEVLGQVYPVTASLGRAFLLLRELDGIVDGLRGEVELVMEAVTQHLIDTMLEDGIDSVSITGTGKSIGTSPEPYAQVKDREALRQWVLADADLSQSLALPYQTLAALTKRRLLEGQSAPPGVEVFIKDRIRVS